MTYGGNKKIQILIYIKKSDTFVIQQLTFFHPQYICVLVSNKA